MTSYQDVLVSFAFYKDSIRSYFTRLCFKNLFLCLSLCICVFARSVVNIQHSVGGHRLCRSHWALQRSRGLTEATGPRRGHRASQRSPGLTEVTGPRRGHRASQRSPGLTEVTRPYRGQWALQRSLSLAEVTEPGRGHQASQRLLGLIEPTVNDVEYHGGHEVTCSSLMVSHTNLMNT